MNIYVGVEWVEQCCWLTTIVYRPQWSFQKMVGTPHLHRTLATDAPTHNLSSHSSAHRLSSDSSHTLRVSSLREKDVRSIRGRLDPTISFTSGKSISTDTLHHFDDDRHASSLKESANDDPSVDQPRGGLLDVSLGEMQNSGADQCPLPSTKKSCLEEDPHCSNQPCAGSELLSH